MKIKITAIPVVFLLLIVPAALFSQRGGAKSVPQGEDQQSAERPVNASSDLQQFKIVMGKNRIGSYEARRQKDGGETTYTAKSETVVSFFGKIRIKYGLVCTYRDGQLVNSEMRSYKNGNLKKETLVKWGGDQYAINADGKKSTLNQPIKKSSIQLYFEEPEDQTKVFSESQGKFKQVNKVSSNQYTLSDIGDDGGTEFIYSGNRLQKVHESLTIGSFTITR